MHVIRRQMSFLDPTLLLLGQPAKYLCMLFSQFPVQRLPSTLRNRHQVEFALPRRVTQTQQILFFRLSAVP